MAVFMLTLWKYYYTRVELNYVANTCTEFNPLLLKVTYWCYCRYKNMPIDFDIYIQHTHQATWSGRMGCWRRAPNTLTHRSLDLTVILVCVWTCRCHRRELLLFSAVVLGPPCSYRHYQLALNIHKRFCAALWINSKQAVFSSLPHSNILVPGTVHISCCWNNVSAKKYVGSSVYTVQPGLRKYVMVKRMPSVAPLVTTRFSQLTWSSYSCERKSASCCLNGDQPARGPYWRTNGSATTPFYRKK